MINRSVAFLLSLSLCLVVGCGDDEWEGKRVKVYKAGGTVLLDGKPLDDAIVVFHSQSHSVSAQGVTDKDGRFQLTTYRENDGAADGPQKVVVTKRIYVEQKTKYDSPTERSVAKIPKDLLPPKYSNPDATPLSATIATSGSNDIKLEVTSK